MGSTIQSYLIVGAGVFGASTALHLRRLDPSATVTLLDRTSFPNPSAASHDVNKIIRADYDDIFYMKLALEAQKLWRDDPIYSPYYHETGMLFAEDMGMGRKAFEHYKTLGGNVPVEMLTPEEARERFPWFKDANWTDVKENFYNPTSGWGEADHALRRLVQAAVDEGAIFVTGTVSKISIDQSGTCTGVLKDDDEELTADHILLCTGPYTAKLLADSAPNKKELQVDGRMVAAAAVQMTAKVDDDHLAKYRQAPVHFNGMYHTHGESIPPTREGILKFNYEVSFTNMVHHKESNQTISVPPTPLGQNTWSQDVPEGLKSEVRQVLPHVYGQDPQGLKIQSYRMCWDAVTPNQDFIVSPHPHCKNLYFAGAGSFHGWKFLPIIGKYVVQMLQGQLEDEKAQRWAWDRPNEGAACVMYIPERDLKNISGYAELNGH